MKKSGTSPKTRILALVFIALFVFGINPAFALPEGESVAAGTATFDRSVPNTLKITTPSDKVIIDYNSFSIASGEYVYFYQPSATSSALNRVTGSDVSNISGTLSANGIIYLVNPNGIIIASSANINAAGFIASTLNITNANFLSGNYIFSKWVDKVGKSVINNGYIKVLEGGQVVLLGSAVANSGTIETTLGSVALAAGEKITLNLDTAGMISVVIDQPVQEQIYDSGGQKLDSAVQNSGKILNPGGKVILAARVLNQVFDSAINNSGIIQANSLVNRNGVVELVADGAPVVNTGIIQAGEVRVNTNGYDFINKGELIGQGLPGILDTGNIYIQAGNILQAGLLTADSLIDLKAEGVYQVVATAALGQGQPAASSPAIIIQAGQVSITAKQFGTTDIPLEIKAGRIYLGRTTGNIEILESLGIGSSVLVRGPPEGFGAILYNKDTSLTLEASQIVISGNEPTHLYGNITFYNLSITVPDKEIYFEAGKTYTFKGTTGIIGAADIGPEEFFIKLRSSQAGKYWYLDLAGSDYTLERVNIRDAYALGKVIIPIGVDAGNNINLEIDPIWDGGGTTNNWSDADNWSGNAVPTPTTDATFDATSVKDSIVDAAFGGTIRDLLINAGYTGTITLERSLTVNRNFSQADGTLNLGSQTFTVAEAFTLSGGTFNAGASTVVLAGTASTINVNTNLTFFNLTFAPTTAGAAKSVSANDTLIVTGTLTLTEGNINQGTIPAAGTISAQGDIIQNSTFDGGTGRIIITGTANQTFTGNATTSSGDLPDLTIDKSAGTLTLAGTIRINGSGAGAWTYTAGTLDAGTSTMVFDGAVTITGSHTLNNVTFNSAGVRTIASGTTLTVAGTLNYNDGTLNTGTIVAQGDIIQGSATDGGSATLQITGSANQTFTGNATTSSGELPDLTIDKSAGTLTLTGTIRINGAGAGAWTYVGGTVDATTNDSLVIFNGANTIDGQGASSTMAFDNVEFTGGTSTLAGDFDVDGNLTISAGTLNTSASDFSVNVAGNWSNAGTFTANSGTVIFDGAGTQTLNSGGTVASKSFNNLTHSGAGTLKLVTNAITINGNFTNSAGTFDANGLTMSVGGNWLNSATFVSGANTVNFTSASIQTLNSGGSAFGNITHSGSGTLQLIANPLTVTSDFTNSSGTFDLNGQDWIMTGAAFSNTATVRLQGGEAITGLTQDVDSGTWTYVGDGDGVVDTFTIKDFGSGDYFNLSINDANATKDIFQLASGLSVAGAFNVTAGTFNANGQTATVAGLTTVNGGTYQASTATQTFNAGLTISSGTFTGSSGAVAINGAFTQSGGAFTAPLASMAISANFTRSGGTFDANGGTVTFTSTVTGRAIDSDGASFYNLTFNGIGGAWTLQSALSVANDISIINGTLSTGANSIIVSGSWSKTGGTFTPGSGTVTFDATTSGKTITSGGAAFNNLTFNGVGGAWTLLDALDVNGNLSITNGTLNAAANSINIDGNFTISSGGVFNEGTSTVILDGAAATIDVNVSETFNNLTFAPVTLGAAKTIAAGDTLIVTGTLTLTEGNINQGTIPAAGTISAQGDIIQNSTFDGGTGRIIITGTANQTFTGNATTTAGDLPDLTIDKSAGTLTLAGTIRINGSGAGAWTYVGGTVDATTNDSLVVFNGANTIDGQGASSTMAFDNVEFTGGTSTLAGDFDVDGNLTISAGTLNTSASDFSVNVAGNWSNSGTFTSNSSVVTFDGSSDATLDTGGTVASKDFQTLVINKSAGAVVTLINNDLDVDGTLTIASGALYLNGRNITTTASFVNNGTLRLQGIETVSWTVNDTDSGTWEYAGRNIAEVITLKDFGASDYFNLVINDTNTNKATFSAGTSGKDIAGAFTISSGTYDANAQATTVSGLTTVNGGVYLASTATQTFNGGLAISSGTFTGSTGAVDVNGFLTLSGGTLTAPSGNFAVSGDWSKSGGIFNAGTGTVTFDGALTQNIASGSSAFYNFTINKSSASAVLQDALDVDNNLTITAGTLNANGKSINVGGNWANSGTFIPNNNTVIFDSLATSVISGSTTFFNFSSTAAGKQIIFTAGTTQTISGTLTLTGASGSLIVLRSSVSGTQWNINPQGASSVSFVDVKDANNTNATAITAPNSKDSGNNTNWNLVAHFVISGSASQIAGTANTLTITAVDGTGGVSTSYAGDKVLIFSGANAIGVFTPTVTDKNGIAVDFGSNATLVFSNGVSSAGGAMVLYKVENASISATQGAIGTASPLSVAVTATGSQLEFVQQPANADFSIIITPPITLKIIDQFGNTVSSDSTTAVTIAVNANLTGAGLFGTLTQTAASGLVNFNDLSINLPGPGYSLTASSAGLISAVSSNFNITGTLPRVSSQLAYAEVLKPLSPDSAQLSLYQVNMFTPVPGPVYFYHPLTPADVSVFEELEKRK